MSSQAEQAVEAINGTFGRHPGSRAAHAKGRVCTGRFDPAAEAGKLTAAQHMREPVRTTVRFSNASGDPDADDRLNARGMSVKFHLPGGADTDIVSVTLRRFFARTPEEFVQLNRTLRRDVDGGPPRPSLRTFLFVALRPGLMKPLTEARSVAAVPSYAACRYSALHSFRWVDSSGGARHVRYRWEPAATVEPLPGRSQRAERRDYLQQEIAERLEAGPVSFRLMVDIAGNGDRVDDPTAVWKQPETVQAGTLEIDGLADEVPEPLVFDPTRLVEGIERSADPVLSFRPAAYAVSVNRRA